MNDERTHEEIADLLGVYALDAVEPDERILVEEHLASCPRCAAEVAEHREVAAQLANTGAAAPEGVWARILDSLEEQPPALDLIAPSRREPAPPGPPVAAPAATPAGASVTSLSERRRLRQWLPLSAAAAVLVIVGMLVGVLLAGDDSSPTGTDEIAQEPSLEDIARRVLNDPTSTKVTLASPDPGSDQPLEATAAVGPDGSGYLLGMSLPALDEAQTYQLWGVHEGAVVSLGLLGHSPGVVAFHLDENITALVITAEVAGGVPQSANDAVVAGNVA